MHFIGNLFTDIYNCGLFLTMFNRCAGNILHVFLLRIDIIEQLYHHDFCHDIFSLQHQFILHIGQILNLTPK